MSKQFRISVFASGGGSNAGEIFKYFQRHESIHVVLLLCNNTQAFALERARQFGIPAKTFTRSEFSDGEILKLLKEYQTTHIVLAGFLWLLPQNILEAYPDRIINIHPALLPRFGGKGMYGMKVHERVRASGEKETGMTIHLVNQNYDEGKIVFQAKCEIKDTESAEQIAVKVNHLEHSNYPRVIEKWISG